MAGILRRVKALIPKRPATAPVSASALLAAVGDPALAARLAVKVSTRARRVSLRVDPSLGQVVLIQPARASVRAVLEFTSARRDWIAERLDALPSRVAFVDGATIPLGGVAHRVRLMPEQRGGVWRENDVIFVTGRAEHAARRLTDWLKGHAKTIIGPHARTMALQIDRKVERVSVRDTVSRWGSCSHTGRLSFSWRLVLAPENVMTYVVAHEVAHLKHMHHGPAFWRTVDALLDGRGIETASARDWLRTHGASLHRYG